MSTVAAPTKIELPPGSYTDNVPPGYTLVITSAGSYLERPAGPQPLSALVPAPAPTPAPAPAPLNPDKKPMPVWLLAVLMLAALLVGHLTSGWHFPVPTPTPAPAPTPPPRPPWLPNPPVPPPTPTPVSLDDLGRLLDGRLAKITPPPAPDNSAVLERLDKLVAAQIPPAQPAPQVAQVQYQQPVTWYYPPQQQPACYYVQGQRVCR
jgi:hypothetical protein